VHAGWQPGKCLTEQGSGGSHPQQQQAEARSAVRESRE
jgi:hypothetical protein